MVYVCVHVCMCVCGGYWLRWCFLLSFCYFLRQGLSLHWLTRSQGSSCPQHYGTLQKHTATLGFSVGSGDPHSGPQACTADILSAKPCPQSLESGFRSTRVRPSYTVSVSEASGRVSTGIGRRRETGPVHQQPSEPLHLEPHVCCL